MKVNIKIKLLIAYLLVVFFSPNVFADINCDQLLYENIHEIKKGDILKTRMKGKVFNCIMNCK